MLITKEEAVAYYERKKGIPVKRVRELANLETGANAIVINDDYVVRYIVPEPMNCLMRNQNFRPKLSGMKLSKDNLIRLLTDNRYMTEYDSAWEEKK